MACGGAAEPPVAPPSAPVPSTRPTVAEAPLPAKLEPCATVEACAKEARERHDHQDVSGERESLARACHLGSMAHCSEGGASWLTEPVDKAHALALFSHACVASSPDPDACAQVVALRSESSDEPQVLRAAAEGACKPGGRDDAAKKARGAACMTLATLRTKEGTAPSDPRVAGLHHDACTLGNQDGCKAEKANAKPELLAGANLHVDGITGNGVKLDEVACKTEGMGGMFGAMTLVTTFAPRKPLLDACAKTKTEVVVRWVGKGGAVTDVHASGGTPAINACVERAISGAKVGIAGACAARFSVH